MSVSFAQFCDQFDVLSREQLLSELTKTAVLVDLHFFRQARIREGDCMIRKDRCGAVCVHQG